MVKEIIHVVLRESLGEKHYNSEEAKIWTREISDVIQTKLKGKYSTSLGASPGPFNQCSYAELQLERYKYVIQVVIGEQRGEGVR